MIYLNPHSGLANRIRAIISGLALSDFLNQNLTVIWRKDSALYCEFEDLFEPQQKFRVIRHSFFSRLLDLGEQKNRVKSALGKTIYHALAINFTLFDKDVEKYVWTTGTDHLNLKVLPPQLKNGYISTCHEFYFDRSYFKSLQPSVQIKKLITDTTGKFSKKTTGVHIRRTDNMESIKGSPLEGFIDMMNRDLIADSETNFFLATDDPEVEKVLIERFPGKIITYKKVYSRQEVKGVQDAMVDLYCLSRTNKIYGSFYSSFSEIASRIENIPLEIIKKS